MCALRLAAHRSRWFAAALLILMAGAAGAQVRVDRPPFALTIEGYVNGTAGYAFGTDAHSQNEPHNVRYDSGLRALGLYQINEDNAIGLRAEELASSDGGLTRGERSVLALGPWGRAEFGRRQGLPTTLYGYAPNTFAFTSSDFSVATGRGLDPGGTLATAFLPADIAGRIDAISSLGAVPTLGNDLSTKVIYLSPKLNGFQGGLSYAFDVDQPAKRFLNLIQGGLAYESYRGRNVYRVGGSFSHADGRQPNAGQPGYRDLESVNFGASATLIDEWTIGAAVTYDGRSGLQKVAIAASEAPAWGVTLSLNYNSGPWTLGGYIQQARSESDPLRPGSDLLQVLQIGVSYRLNTKVRLYSASYFYRFNDEGGTSAADRSRGTVLLAGVRLTL